MGYSEKDGQVVLTMSREDYDELLKVFAGATVAAFPNTMWILRLLNRLNQGNPHYTPYRVGEKKS
jgi:hypothetical protein